MIETVDFQTASIIFLIDEDEKMNPQIILCFSF